MPATKTELKALTKLARLSPQELRALFARHGTISGGLRGAALGAAGGYLLSDTSDLPATLGHVLGGAAAGGAGGALIGRIQGLRRYSDPFRVTTTPDGARYVHLKTPGTFGEELVHAHIPARDVDPKEGGGLLGALLEHGEIPESLIFEGSAKKRV